MYNMNASSLLSVAETGSTPRTPEILNSLIAMTNPFDRLRATSQGPVGQPASPPSDTASSAGSPPSVQHTCSQLIKEGLKLTIQTKRRNNGEMLPQANRRLGPGRLSPDSQHCDTSNEGLTPEDEERRRRRRERNKIAATKCRLKKRERTVNLVYESEILETQNHDLKSKIQELETQRRRLVDILTVHRPNCSKHPFPGTSRSFQDFSRSSQPIMEAHTSYSYSGPSSSYHHEVSYSRGGLVETSVMEESSSTSYLIHQGTNYSSPTYKDREPVIAYNRSVGEPIYTNLSPEVRSYSSSLGSGGSPSYSRPSTLVINTSSSDYESNTEIMDSPSTQHHPNYSFDEEDGFSASFTTSSCIT